MSAARGTYALVAACRASAAVEVGRLGTIELLPGFYIYVGSAFGPGGVKTRVERHWRDRKRIHWHIDYLTPMLAPRCVLFRHREVREEHRWARALAAMDGFCPVPRFGASDCRCVSHLFHCGAEPRARLFEQIWGSGIRRQRAPN